MDRTAARMIIRRVLTAMLYQKRLAGVKKQAGLPTGDMMIGLDALARAQFLEGLAGKAFNSVSAPAGRGKSAAGAVIKKILLILDPTLDVDSPDVRQWVSMEGSSGLYKAAWLGANKVLSRSGVKRPKELFKENMPVAPVKYLKGGPRTPKTADAVGMEFEPEDVLSANMLQFIDPGDTPKMSEGEIEELASASMEEKMEALEGQESAIRAEALSEAAAAGNFFWTAGKSVQAKKEAILSGKISIDRLGGIVARYATNAALNVVKHANAEARALAKMMGLQAIPGTEDERAEFDLGTLSEDGWGYVIQAILADPSSDFAAQVFNWMKDDVKTSKLSDREQVIMEAYIDAVIDGRLSSLQSDAAFADDFKRSNPALTTSAADVGNIKSKYLGKGGAEVAKRLKQDAPQFLLDAEDTLFLMNAQKGRGRFASRGRTAAERALRSQVIRLAHQNPALRPHLLPLLKRSAEEGPEAGRTWGGPGAGRDWDWHKPEYETHEDSPPAGENNSEQRAKYNRWYRENVCPTDHGTGCGL